MRGPTFFIRKLSTGWTPPFFHVKLSHLPADFSNLELYIKRPSRLPQSSSLEREKGEKPDMGRSRRIFQGEDMAMTKAAAWAWHQRTTVASGRHVTPFVDGATVVPKHRRPSRHKLEADAAAAAAARSISQPPLGRSDSLPLLDGYEIRRISLDLDRHILAACSFRELPAKQPTKRPEKSRKFLGSRVLRYFAWRSNRVEQESCFSPIEARRHRYKY